LTASAGISINKFLAKVASDYQKPDGLFVIRPEDAERFVEQLPVEKFFGVGKVTSRKMKQMGIIKGLDLKRFDVQELIRKFGKVGAFYYDMARAIDTRPVEPERIRKSVSVERTFDADLVKMYEIQKELLELEKMLIERLMKTGFKGRTLTLKVKFDNFQQITRSKSLHTTIKYKMIHPIATELVSGVNYANHTIRLLGLTISNAPEKKQSEQLLLDF
jgi:DNA polymerase-4